MRVRSQGTARGNWGAAARRAAPDPAGVLQLQRLAGNAATAGLVRRASLQRWPLAGDDLVDAMVAKARGTGQTFYTKDLQVEAEVFGDVDLSRDLQAIAIPKTAYSLAGARTGVRDQRLDDTLRKNVRAFCRANSIKLIEYDPGMWQTVVLGSDVTKAAFKTAIQRAL